MQSFFFMKNVTSRHTLSSDRRYRAFHAGALSPPARQRHPQTQPQEHHAAHTVQPQAGARAALQPRADATGPGEAASRKVMSCIHLTGTQQHPAKRRQTDTV